MATAIAYHTTAKMSCQLYDAFSENNATQVLSYKHYGAIHVYFSHRPLRSLTPKALSSLCLAQTLSQRSQIFAHKGQKPRRKVEFKWSPWTNRKLSGGRRLVHAYRVGLNLSAFKTHWLWLCGYTPFLP